MKKVLITGGAGFIGSHLALRLIERGHSVTVLDNLSEQIHGPDPERTSPLFASIMHRVHFIRGTVEVRDDWVRACRDQQVVVHLAAETGTGQSMYQVEKYSRVNVLGTTILLDMLANDPNTVEKVVVASSRAIYGEGRYRSPELGIVYPGPRAHADMKAGDFEVKVPGSGPLEVLPTDESSRLHPSSVYGITKQVQEQMVLNVCSACGLGAVAFRYQNVYGPGQSLNNPYTGILSIFSNRMRAGQPINVFEDGRESRDFVFITDVVDATVAGIEQDGANGMAVNVGTGHPTTVLEVAHKLADALGAEGAIQVSGMYRVGDIRHNIADIALLRRTLGVHPQVMFNDGIERFARWVQTQDTAGQGYERSLQEMRQRGLLRAG